jgi:hypothetical protein
MQLLNADAASNFLGSGTEKQALWAIRWVADLHFSPPEIQLLTACSMLLQGLPAETNPSAIAQAVGITAPAIVFSGTEDAVKPPVGSPHSNFQQYI